MKDLFPFHCTYCWKVDKDVKPLPKELKDSPRNKYCKKCWPEVFAEVSRQPWNRLR